MLSGSFTPRCKLKSTMALMDSTVRLPHHCLDTPYNLYKPCPSPDIGRGQYEPLYTNEPPRAHHPVDYGGTHI